MSKTTIPPKTANLLWGKSGGRCHYCNKPIWYDDMTKWEFNSSYIAHIYADQPGGPRWHPTLSEKLKKDISNLMLLCDNHHRLIDVVDVDGHPPELLQEMKKKHENRMEILTSLTEDKRSHVLLYGANIGEQNSSITRNKASQAMLPAKYPADKTPIELSFKNSSFYDNETIFWEIERENLRRQFNQNVKNRLGLGEIEHFSVFALAPQPLLMELGRLLSDIPTAEIYQLHREPPDWIWQEDPKDFEYFINEPENKFNKIALNLSLSATIDNSRITDILGSDTSIWTLTVNDRNNDFLKSKKQLSLFREKFRKLLDIIKAKHGQNNILHIFPAVPVSVAVEIGRTWMPKADLPLSIYDQNWKTGGFSKAFDISSMLKNDKILI